VLHGGAAARLRVGDLGGADQDRAALHVVVVDRVAVVVGVVRVGARLHHLDPVALEEQGGEQGETEDRHLLDGPVHPCTALFDPSWPGLRGSKNPGGADSGSAGGSGRRAASEIRSSSAARIQLASRAEPPAARNGIGSPVSGITRITPPAVMNTCSAKVTARPAANSLPYGSRTSSAVFRPRATNRP